jgi:membrane protein
MAGWLDHLARAAVRYDQADGGRLAAAMTYYAFFATFALALLSFAAFGFVLDDPVVLRDVQSYLAESLPRVDVRALRDARGTVGVIGFIGLPISGWFWIDALRSSIRAIWRLPEYPGTLLVRVLIDLLVLVGLGLLLAASLAAVFAATAGTGRLVTAAGVDPAPARWLLGALGFVLGVGVNTLLSIAVLTGLPRLRMPLRGSWVPRCSSPPAWNCSRPSAGSTCAAPRPTPPTWSLPAPSGCWSSSTPSTN